MDLSDFISPLDTVVERAVMLSHIHCEFKLSYDGAWVMEGDERKVPRLVYLAC